MRLEEIVPSSRLSGIKPGSPVTVIATTQYGVDAVQVSYRDDQGTLGETILYRDAEDRIAPYLSTGRPFDADPQEFRLVAEAQRIMLAGFHDPMLAVTTSNVQPLPHQIRAVYGEMLPRTPLRFLLADDPGAGKTIMAGLYIKELVLREDVHRCLIVAPGGLVEQWQDELKTKFGLDFGLLTAADLDRAPGTNVFDQHPLLIARMDQLARSDAWLHELEDADFDLVVVDEAHRMSAQWFGGELRKSRRFELGELLSERTRHLLLMTATPHNGNDEDFQTFLSLLDRDRFEGPNTRAVTSGTVDGLMRRMIKEDLLTFEGKPLFPERTAETVSYRLSAAEWELYEAVTDYVRNGMNRAEKLDGKRRNTVGFALTVLQRRLASSPEAIYQSLRRRADRLEKVRNDLLTGGMRPPADPAVPSALLEDDPDYDEVDAEELESAEDELVDAATAAQTVEELEKEIAELRLLAEMAGQVLHTQPDVKWNELRGVLESEILRSPDGSPTKLIVFTEHKDTLNYLEERVGTLLGRPDAVVSIHGGVPRTERRRITAEFTNNPDVQVLIATDAAGEGLNLQRAHLMVNYDLPWNPNRIEQRFGRIHRIGQQEVCRLWNLVAQDTREGDVFERLLDKIEEQRLAYGGKVFNVLGTSMGGLSLAKLIKEAILYGERPEVRARMEQTIDGSVSAGLREVLEEDALAHEALAPSDLDALRARMEEARARRLQPHFIRDAFVAAFRKLGGTIERRERGRFEILHVPADIRDRHWHFAVARKYERVCFTPDAIDLDGAPSAELLAPGHPLHDATLAVLLDRYKDLLERGAVLTADEIREPTLMVGVLNEVRDATGATVSKQFGYSFVGEDGRVREAGPAPYLDFAGGPHEAAAGLTWPAEREREAIGWVVAEQLPGFVETTTQQRRFEFGRVRERVQARLTGEINRLETEALKADEDARAGKRIRYSPDTLRRKAEDLARRRAARLALLDQQLVMTALPPRITAIALVVPRPAAASEPPPHATVTAEIERRGVDAVLRAEIALGRRPEEQAHSNPGFDILSTRPGEPSIRIEVKARIAGAASFDITRREVLTALNAAPNHRLALVSVSPEGPEHDEVRYLSNVFAGVEPAWLEVFAANRHELDWKTYWERGGAPH